MHARLNFVFSSCSIADILRSFHTRKEIEFLSESMKRGDELPEEALPDWDVPMSGVIHATAPTSTVSVRASYSIATPLIVTVTVTATEVTYVQDFLKASMTIAYGTTWTSTYTAGYTFVVPAGSHDMVISNPQVSETFWGHGLGCSRVVKKSLG